MEEEEDAVEGRDSSLSGAECDQDPESQGSTRPKKRRCFWEYSHGHEAGSKREGGKLPVSWSPSTLPSTLYLKEDTSASGKKCQRKARKTDASDLTPNPQKLCHIGDQLLRLNAAIEGMRPVNDLAVIARARSRKEKNKLASRACRLKKKAQHEANKIKLWGLNQEYDNLLGALLRIKEIIRQRVESSEEEKEPGMTQRLESILKESAGPRVAGRTKEFVEKILECSAVGQGTKRPQKKDPSA
ncbi:CREB3 regulatory factor-like [Megalops cyprinoides]|uniref:CREB3 regulatory factor-like n=1 Tax=Megalops cyprinoides TaxID=118141 RepID=UPI001864BDA7|nr:CREB3 regulatory factor-like [Megalops cyprinoides]